MKGQPITYFMVKVNLKTKKKKKKTKNFLNNEDREKNVGRLDLMRIERS